MTEDLEPADPTFTCERCKRLVSRSYNNVSLAGDECTCDWPVTEEDVERRAKSVIYISIGAAVLLTVLLHFSWPSPVEWFIGLPAFAAVYFVTSRQAGRVSTETATVSDDDLAQGR
jgi:hypothetical protein